MPSIIISPDMLKNLDSDVDRDFCSRLYKTADSVYMNRLKAIGFEDYSYVLDAGCGFGQWTFKLAELNKQVCAFDISGKRINFCKKLQKNYSGYGNITFCVDNLEVINHQDGVFDAVFSYSSIYQADYRKAFNQIHRLLKPRGRFYFSSNDLGWYIYNIIDQHNPSKDYSPRQMAIDTIENTINYYSKGINEAGKCLVMQKDLILKELSEMGFRLIAEGADGSINIGNIPEVKSFYEVYKYNLINVYEILCEKL